MLTCSHLKKSYFNKTAVKDISLTLEKGKVYALLGPNGSGKTTFMKMAAGLIKPTQGTILYENRPIATASKKDIAYMSTEPYFYSFMTVESVGKYYQDFFEDFDADLYRQLTLNENQRMIQTNQRSFLLTDFGCKKWLELTTTTKKLSHFT